jgi:hypothetical protein
MASPWLAATSLLERPTRLRNLPPTKLLECATSEPGPLPTNWEKFSETIEQTIPATKKKRAHMLENKAKITHGQLAPLAKLLALDAEELSKTLIDIQQTRAWSESTLISRCNTLIAMCVHLPTTRREAIRSCLVTLRRQASVIQLPTWQPEESEQCMTPDCAAALWEKIESAPELILPILVAFIAGQRNGDVLLWRTAFVQQRVRTDGTKNTTVTVVEGKTVHATGPYTLHFPFDSQIALLIWNRKLEREKINKPYLFLDSDKLLKHGEARLLVRASQAKMKTVFTGDLRSSRRGGLSNLAQQNVPETQLLTLSRHPGVDMLRRYLAAGRLNNHEATLQMEAIALNEESIRQTVVEMRANQRRSSPAL